MKEEDLRKINVKIESSTKSAVRTAVVSGCCTEKRENMVKRTNGIKGQTGSIVLVFRGDHTIVGGHGQIFDFFCQSGQLEGYPGQGTQIAWSHETHYDTAELKVMQFHETYSNLRYDVNHSKIQ